MSDDLILMESLEPRDTKTVNACLSLCFFVGVGVGAPILDIVAALGGSNPGDTERFDRTGCTSASIC